MVASLLLLQLLGCAAEPDPCLAMCDAAAGLYGSCLADWGVGWEAAGYVDEDDFLDGCETWAWELRILEAEAVRRDELDQAGAVDGLCEQREVALTEAAADPDDLECSAYTEIDWNEPPW